MLASNKFPMRIINVDEVLRSPIMVGQYRGEEVWGEVENTMEAVSPRTLVLIDIRKAMPLQYTFCQYAFGPLLEALHSNRWKDKYVMFQMYDFHRTGFFRGILKHLRVDLPRKESEREFVAAGFYLKLVIGDKRLITFAGNLTENQEQALLAVNELKEITSRQVIDKLSVSEESVVDALRFLVSKHLIVSHEPRKDSTPKYYSFYEYLHKGGN